ncbi:hypothetical protein TcasGA2_TC014628, partial [Tribolium castaneum]
CGVKPGLNAGGGFPPKPFPASKPPEPAVKLNEGLGGSAEPNEKTGGFVPSVPNAKTPLCVTGGLAPKVAPPKVLPPPPNGLAASAGLSNAELEPKVEEKVLLLAEKPDAVVVKTVEFVPKLAVVVTPKAELPGVPNEGVGWLLGSLNAELCPLPNELPKEEPAVPKVLEPPKILLVVVATAPKTFWLELFAPKAEVVPKVLVVPKLEPVVENKGPVAACCPKTGFAPLAPPPKFAVVLVPKTGFENVEVVDATVLLKLVVGLKAKGIAEVVVTGGRAKLLEVVTGDIVNELGAEKFNDGFAEPLKADLGSNRPGVVEGVKLGAKVAVEVAVLVLPNENIDGLLEDGGGLNIDELAVWSGFGGRMNVLVVGELVLFTENMVADGIRKFLLGESLEVVVTPNVGKVVTGLEEVTCASCNEFAGLIVPKVLTGFSAGADVVTAGLLN